MNEPTPQGTRRPTGRHDHSHLPGVRPETHGDCFEAETIRLFQTYQETHAETWGDWHFSGIKSTFTAMWTASLTADRIARVGSAMLGCDDDEAFRATTQAYLTKLCRAKVLRSRRCQGKTLYEVNY